MFKNFEKINENVIKNFILMVKKLAKYCKFDKNVKFISQF